MKTKIFTLLILSLLFLNGCSNVSISEELKNEIKNSMNENSNVSFDDSEMINELLTNINLYRSENNLENLELSEELNEIAKIRAKEIVQNFSHERVDGSNYVSLIKEAQYKCSLAGENLGQYQKDIYELLKEWKNSDAHNANLLGDFTETGIAIYKEKDLLYFVQIFTK